MHGAVIASVELPSQLALSLGWGLTKALCDGRCPLAASRRVGRSTASSVPSAGGVFVGAGGTKAPKLVADSGLATGAIRRMSA